MVSGACHTPGGPAELPPPQRGLCSVRDVLRVRAGRRHRSLERGGTSAGVWSLSKVDVKVLMRTCWDSVSRGHQKRLSHGAAMSNSNWGRRPHRAGVLRQTCVHAPLLLPPWRRLPASRGPQPRAGGRPNAAGAELRLFLASLPATRWGPQDTHGTSGHHRGSR